MPRTDKIFKNGLRVFIRGENLLQLVYCTFYLRLSQSSEIGVTTDEKVTILKKGLGT